MIHHQQGSQPAPATPDGPPDTETVSRYRKLFGGALVANHGYQARTGDALVEAGRADEHARAIEALKAEF